MSEQANLQPNVRKLWRVLWRGFWLTLALGLVLAIAALAWLSQREQTLQWLAQEAVIASRGALPGTLRIDGVSGKLTDTIRIASLSYTSAEQAISAQQIALQWTPLQLLLKRVAISRLQIGSLRIETLKSSDEALKLPASLALPLPVRIGDAKLAQLIIVTADQKTVIDQLHFALSADRQGWRLSDASAVTPWGKVDGGLSLVANRPFVIGGKINFVTKPQTPGQTPIALPEKIQASVAGNLSDLLLSANTASQGAQASVEVRLRPFEKQPLQALKLKLSNVNPALLHKKMLQLLSSLWVTRAVGTFARLGLADVMEDGVEDHDPGGHHVSW